MDGNTISAMDSASLIQSQVQLAQQQAQSGSFQNVLDKAMQAKDDVQLKQACQDFESYFLQMMWKEMRNTVDTSGSFLQPDQTEQIFQDMLDEENSKAAASTGKLGLADQMYKQMSRQMNAGQIPQVQ